MLMEFELEQDIVRGYELLGQTSICQEETQEAIVPDACPDILRLVDVCAQVFPERWEAGENQISAAGTIQVNLLYTPENGRELQRMGLKLPFQCQTEQKGCTPDSMLEICTRLRSADARLLNPRKVLFRMDLAVEFTVFQPREYSVCSGAQAEEKGTLCQLPEELEHECLTCIPQRVFPISEEISLPGTGGDAPVLLDSRLRAICSESRVIGNKLVLKGKVDADLLLQGADGLPECRTESFPFSQIMEAKGVGESGLCQVWLEVRSMTCTQLPEDRSRILLEAEILAQGQVRERKTLRVLKDIYSTSHELETEHRTLSLYGPGENMTLPQTLRDLLETEDIVRSICDCRFLLKQVVRSREADQLTLTAQGRVVVRYLDEHRCLKAAEKPVELPIRLNCPEGSECICHCFCPEETFASPCAGGIEIRFGVEFRIQLLHPMAIEVISKASMGEPRRQNGRRPSMILRLPEEGETLWDLAKSCGTTKERILQANELESEDIPRQKMLLIPSAR